MCRMARCAAIDLARPLLMVWDSYAAHRVLPPCVCVQGSRGAVAAINGTLLLVNTTISGTGSSPVRAVRDRRGWGRFRV